MPRVSPIRTACFISRTSVKGLPSGEGGGGRGHGFFTASEHVLEHPPPERPDELAHLPLTNATPFIYLV